MAAAFVNIDIQAQGAGNPASWTHGVPSGMANGHFEMVFSFASAAVASKSISTDGGSWTTYVNEVCDNNGNQQGRICVWHKPVAETPASVTVTPSASTPGFVSARMAFSGVDLAAPIPVRTDPWLEGTVPASASDPIIFNIPGLTTPSDNCLALAWVAWRCGYGTNIGGWRATAHPDWTRRVAHASNLHGDHVFLAVITRPIPTAGPTGDTWVQPNGTGTNVSRNWIAGMIVLAPPAGGGGASARRRVTFVM